MDLVLVCRVSGYIIAVVEDKIVKTLTRVWVSDAKKFLIRALPGGVINADDNINNSSALSIGWVGNSTDMIVDGKIVKVLTRIGIEDAEKILTGALPSRVEDANDVATG